MDEVVTGGEEDDCLPMLLATDWNLHGTNLYVWVGTVQVDEVVTGGEVL